MQKETQLKTTEFKELQETIIELRAELEKTNEDKQSDKAPLNPKERRFSDMLLQVTTDLAKTKSLDEAVDTLVKITTTTIGQKEHDFS